MIFAPYWGWTEKRPSMKTIAPGAAQSQHSSMPSQATASTVPVRSATTRRMKSSPFFRVRRSRSRTANAPATSWPSASSRTNTLISGTAAGAAPRGACNASILA